MVTKVNATNEFWLLSNSEQILRRLARDSLISFSINKLRELKLVTANFKNGFDFSDSYYLKYDLKKFFKIILTYLNKAIPFLPEYAPNFTAVLNASRPYVRIECIYDEAVIRYIGRLSIKFHQYGLPYSITVSERYPQDNLMFITFNNEAYNANVCLNTYKLLLLIPEAQKILKTLSRKARFDNEQLRANFRPEAPSIQTTPTA